MAKIGSLTADLRLESASFIRDMRRAAQETARSTTAMQRSMASVQRGFAAAGAQLKTFVGAFVSVAAVRGLVSLGRTAIQVGDDIAAAAAKIGISGEELQRLRFAAQQADVEIGELDNALKLFQKSLATGAIASQSFSDFIQSIRDAPTQIDKVRISTEALSGTAFQTGLLLAHAGDEFAKTFQAAFVVSNEALRIAGELDNEWHSLTQAIGAGFQTGFLESFVGGAKRSHEELEKFNEAAKILGGLFGSTVSGVNRIAGAFVGLRETIFQAREEIRKLQAERAGKTFLPSLEFDMLPKFDSSILDDVKPKIDGINQAIISNADAAKMAREANAAWLERLNAGAAIFEATRTPLEAYAIELNRLNELLRQGAINADTFGRAQAMAAAAALLPWLQVAGTIGQALGILFEENKAIAIAQAIINTLQGITAAIAQYPPPLSYAMAAAQAALGFAQVAKIQSTTPGGGAGSAKGLAHGGIVPGSGTGDKVSALLEPREFVVNRDAAQRNLALLHAINQNRMAAGGIIGGGGGGRLQLGNTIIIRNEGFTVYDETTLRRVGDRLSRAQDRVSRRRHGAGR